MPTSPTEYYYLDASPRPTRYGPTPEQAAERELLWLVRQAMTEHLAEEADIAEESAYLCDCWATFYDAYHRPDLAELYRRDAADYRTTARACREGETP